MGLLAMNANIIELLTLAQLSQGQDWPCASVSDSAANILSGITRRPSLLQLDGQRRDLGRITRVHPRRRGPFLP